MRYLKTWIADSEKEDTTNKDYSTCIKKCLYTEYLSDKNRDIFGSYRIKDVSRVFQNVIDCLL